MGGSSRANATFPPCFGAEKPLVSAPFANAYPRTSRSHALLAIAQARIRFHGGGLMLDLASRKPVSRAGRRSSAVSARQHWSRQVVPRRHYGTHRVPPPDLVCDSSASAGIPGGASLVIAGCEGTMLEDGKELSSCDLPAAEAAVGWRWSTRIFGARGRSVREF